MKDQFDTASTTSLQRALGRLMIKADVTASGSHRCANLRQEGSFRALFPKVHHGGVEAVLLNTAGGITGGDRFEVSGVAADNALLTMTTQAAERVYRATGDLMGQIHTDLRVGANARLNWMPQETILFDGCALSRRLKVSVTETSTFLMVEPLVFGRKASDETITSGQLSDRVTITKDNIPIYADGLQMSGNIAEQLHNMAIGQGAAAMANVVYYDQNATSFLEQIRDFLPSSAGATLLTEDLLIVRILAPDGYLLRKTLVPILTHLNKNSLPKNWRL